MMTACKNAASWLAGWSHSTKGFATSTTDAPLSAALWSVRLTDVNENSTEPECVRCTTGDSAKDKIYTHRNAFQRTFPAKLTDAKTGPELRGFVHSTTAGTGTESHLTRHGVGETLPIRAGGMPHLERSARLKDAAGHIPLRDFAACTTQDGAKGFLLTNPSEKDGAISARSKGAKGRKDHAGTAGCTILGSSAISRWSPGNSPDAHGTRSRLGRDVSTITGTGRSRLRPDGTLNNVSSWPNTLAAIYGAMSRCITSTATAPTTRLKTWSFGRYLSRAASGLTTRRDGRLIGYANMPLTA